MILAAALTIASVLGLLGLVAHCIWWCSRNPPRNRYIKRPPSRDCQRTADWRAHIPNTRY